jgi:nucleoid-associated protein YgaU
MEYTGAQLQYLDHLGIDVWVTRESLLNSEPLNDDVAQQAQPQAPVAPPVQPIQPAPVQAGTVELVPVQAPIQAPVQVPAAALAAAPASANTGSPLSVVPAFPVMDKTTSADNQAGIQAPPIFNIQFWCYSTGIWLVSGNVNLAPEHHKLAHSIAQFVQGKKRKPKHVGIFSWPMLDSPNIDQGPEIASKHLKDHIHRLQAVSTVTKVIAFADCGGWLEHLNPVKLSVTLDDVLNSTESKKALWQQLIPHEITE